MNPLRLGAIIFGNILSMLLFLSPMRTFVRIVRNKSTGEFSGILYVVTLLNCLLSCWYQLPFITLNNYYVAVINGIGALIELGYVITFLLYAPKRERIKLSVLLFFVVAIFSTIALVSTLVIHRATMDKRHQLCGLASSTLAIMMYASPLSIMSTVIRTKSVEFMPFLPSLFIFLCGTNAVIYGIIRFDKYIYIPGGCGSILGATQIIVYAIYRNNKGGESTPSTADESARRVEETIA